MIILNEREYAESCIQNGILDKKPAITLHIIAKYLYHIKGLRKRKIFLFLAEFMEKNYLRYSKSKNSWNATIEKIAAKAGKYPLYEISEIWITDNELKRIDTVPLSKNHKVVAFTLLCLAKFYNFRNSKNNGWVNNDVSEVFKLAHISTTSTRQEEILGDLALFGLIEIPKKIDNLSNRVTFIDDNSKKAIKVNDYRELGYVYLQYKGENIIQCQSCGVLIRGNKYKTKKYCANCVAHESQNTKTIICVDCGKKVTILKSNHRSIRCLDCQRKKQLEYQRRSMNKSRNVK